MAFAAILELFWWGIGYAVARLVLPLLSFGKVRAGPPDSSGFNWLGYRRNEFGIFEIAPTLATLIGLMVCCAGLAVALYFTH